MKKIPYGLSDFKRLKTENYFFIDKTRYLEIIENYNSNYLMFLRPRRFGKSLFIAILEAYYNIYFKSEESSESIYNTDMILYFVDKFIAHYKLPREMIDINVRSDYSRLRSIIYTNKKLNGNFQTLQTFNRWRVYCNIKFGSRF